MADEPNTPVPSLIDGGEATDQEALLASQLDTIGDNPTEEPAPAEAAKTAEPAPPATPEPVEPVAAAPAPAAPPAAPVAAPVVDNPPQPPRDFDADLAENQRQFDDGEIEGDAYQKTLRALTKEEGQYTARLEIYNERRQSAEQQSAAQFNVAALAWEQAHADFMQNPLRAQQMQNAVNVIAQQNPGLAPADLFSEAAKVVFEAFGYVPKTVADPAAAVATALAVRTNPGVPPTLGNAPAAGAIERAPGNTQFAALDALGIDDLEAALARMPKDQQDAYLRDAPGATATGT